MLPGGQLQDAIEALQDLFRVLPGAARGIGEDNAGRVIAAPSAVVPGQRPGIRSLSGRDPGPGPVPWSRLLPGRRMRSMLPRGHEQFARALQVLGEPVDYGTEVEGGGANPIGERAAVNVDPGPGQDLALAV